MVEIDEQHTQRSGTQSVPLRSNSRNFDDNIKEALNK